MIDLHSRNGVTPSDGGDGAATDGGWSGNGKFSRQLLIPTTAAGPRVEMWAPS